MKRIKKWFKKINKIIKDAINWYIDSIKEIKS